MYQLSFGLMYEVIRGVSTCALHHRCRQIRERLRCEAGRTVEADQSLDFGLDWQDLNALEGFKTPDLDGAIVGAGEERLASDSQRQDGRFMCTDCRVLLKRLQREDLLISCCLHRWTSPRWPIGDSLGGKRGSKCFCRGSF